MTGIIPTIQGVAELDAYVLAKKSFRKRLRECATLEELGTFLDYIAEANSSLGCTFTYKLACKNRYCVPFEDIILSRNINTIFCHFYLQGSRTYKGIGDFANYVYLIKYDY